MAMQLVAMIRFNDADSGDEALAMMRAGEGTIALTLTLDGVGEVEVFFGLGECEELRAALTKASAIVREE
jgi:hypothetical protein